jgi:hypothetical protein
MAYTFWSVIAGEVPTESKWNLLGQNDADFNTKLTALLAGTSNVPESSIVFAETGHRHQGSTDGSTFYQRIGFVWGLRGSLYVGNAQGMKYIVPYAMTAISLKAKTDVGSCAVRIQRNGANIATGTISASVGTVNINVALVANDVITLDITSVTGASGLWAELLERHYLLNA